MAGCYKPSPRPITLKTLSIFSRLGIDIDCVLDHGSIADMAEVLFILAAPEDLVKQTVYNEPGKLSERADDWMETQTQETLNALIAALDAQTKTVKELSAVPANQDSADAEKNAQRPAGSQ